MKSIYPILISGLLFAGFASSCTVTRVNSREGPPRIESHGMVEGHAAIGILAENQLLNVDIFDGTSEGAIFEFGLWKLLRLEVGLAGAAASVGPFHLGAGVLSYEPVVPRMTSQGNSDGAGRDETCVDEEIEEEIEKLEEELEGLEAEANAVFIDAPDHSGGSSNPVFEVDPKEFTKD